MGNGFHHSDIVLPAADNEISTETLFGAKAEAMDRPHLSMADFPTPVEAKIYHDEGVENEKEEEISNGENPFDRGSFQGVNEHPTFNPNMEIAKAEMHVVFDEGEELPLKQDHVDTGLVFGTPGLNMD